MTGVEGMIKSLIDENMVCLKTAAENKLCPHLSFLRDSYDRKMSLNVGLTKREIPR